MNKMITLLYATIAILLAGHFGFGTATAAERRVETAAVFAPTSFWYTPLPADVPLHPNSANFVDEFLRQKKACYGNVSINLKSYASPVYIAGADTSTVRVREWDCQKKGFSDPRLAGQWKEVPN